MFTHTDAKTRPDWEFVLTADEFGRYRGAYIQPFYTPGTANAATDSDCGFTTSAMIILANHCGLRTAV